MGHNSVDCFQELSEKEENVSLTIKRVKSMGFDDDYLFTGYIWRWMAVIGYESEAGTCRCFAFADTIKEADRLATAMYRGVART